MDTSRTKHSLAAKLDLYSNPYEQAPVLGTQSGSHGSPIQHDYSIGSLRAAQGALRPSSIIQIRFKYHL